MCTYNVLKVKKNHRFLVEKKSALSANMRHIILDDSPETVLSLVRNKSRISIYGSKKKNIWFYKLTLQP